MEVRRATNTKQGAVARRRRTTSQLSASFLLLGFTDDTSQTSESAADRADWLNNHPLVCRVEAAHARTHFLLPLSAPVNSTINIF